MPRNLFAFAAVFLPLAALAAAAPSHADPIDDYVAAEMKAQHIPGLSLALVKDGKIVKSKGYGLANVELGVAATDKTVYEVASLTKQFTAAAVLLLVQDKKLSLDDSVDRYLDKTPPAWRGITIRQLLGQTSGIKDVLNELHGSTRNGTTVDEIVGAVAGYPLDFPSGTDWSYSNTNYLLLGMIVEKVSGLPFDQYLTNQAFRPLGMSATRLGSAVDIIPNRSGNYAYTDHLANAGWYDPTLWAHGEAGLVSSAADLARWEAALLDGRILTPESKAAMWTPARLADGTSYPYGLGWYLWTVDGHRVVSHSGRLIGFSSSLAVYPDAHLGVVVLTNLTDINTGALAGHIAALCDPDVAPRLQEQTGGPSPAAARTVRRFLEGLRNGRLDESLLDDKMKAGATPEFVTYARRFLRPFGELRSLVFVSRVDRPEGARYRYEAIFADSGLDVEVTLTPDGKIDAAGWAE